MLQLHKLYDVMRAGGNFYCISIFDIYLVDIGRDDTWFKWANSFKLNICDSLRM